MILRSLSGLSWLSLALLFGCAEEDPPRRHVGGKTKPAIDAAQPRVKPPGAKAVGVNLPGNNPPVRRPPRDDRPWRTRETRMLTAAEARTTDGDSFLISPDGRHHAYAIEKAEGRVYVVDGVAQATPYRRFYGARFSDDGKDFACIGVVDDGKSGRAKFAVVLNGKPFVLPYVSHFDVYPKTHAIIAVGGGRVAYTAWTQPNPKNQFEWLLTLMADGKLVSKSTAHNKYSTIRPHRRAGIALKGKLRLATPTADGITVDGKLAFRTRDVVKQVVLSANGATWAAVVEATAPKKEVYVVVNGQEQKRFEAVHKLVVTPDGKHVGYLAVLGKKYVVVDGKGTQADWPKPTSDYYDARPSLVLGSSGQNWAVGGDGKPVSSDAAAWPDLPYVGYAAPSPDGRHVAAVALVTERQGEKTVYSSALIRNGKEVFRQPESGLYSRIQFPGGPVWSPDSSSLAIVALTTDRKSYQVIRDGVAGPAFESILMRPDGKTPLVEFSRDGASLAYPVRVGLETKVVINDQPRGAYDLVGFGKTRIGFTPDGRVTYLARKSDGSIWWIEERPPGP